MFKQFTFLLLLILVMPMVSAKTILVLGDSISAGYGLKIDQGWVNLLQKKLTDQNLPYSMVNESISGDTSAGGVARIDRAISQHNPAILLLELGANDGLRGLPPKQMQQNLSRIISSAKQHGAKVLLLSMRIPPNYGKRYTEMFYNVYPELAKIHTIPYVPFLIEDVALKEQYMQRDGLHPNAAAQPIIADVVWEYLEPML